MSETVSAADGIAAGPDFVAEAVSVNSAGAVALIAATLNLTVAVVLTVISRAPGWKPTRAFAAVAATASLYSWASACLSLSGCPPTLYLSAMRLAVAAAHANALAWLVVAYGGPRTEWQSLPAWMRAGIGCSAIGGAVILATGLTSSEPISTVVVGWAGATYHTPTLTEVGAVYAALIIGHYALTFGHLVRRLIAGERALLLQVLTFGALVAACVAELMFVADKRPGFAPGDIAAVVVIVPIAVGAMRRFVDDAGRVSERSGELAGTVLAQTEWRDRATDALAESERMAALGRMAAGVGHEINNPLTYLTLSVGEVESHLRRTHAPPDVMAAISHARDGATRIQRVVERLLSYSRRHDTRMPVDVRDIVAAAVRVAAPSLSADIHVAFSLDDVPPILGDESRLVQAVVNLLNNAAQAVRATAGERTVRVTTSVDASGQVTLTVEDNGPGIPAEHVSRLGEPYFTTRADRGALGLGLFVTRGILDAHHASFDVLSQLGAGTIVRITFPPAPADAPLPVATTVPEPAWGGDGPLPEDVGDDKGSPPTAAHADSAEAASTSLPAVLIVDDEPLVAKLLATILKRNWDVTLAANGAVALEWLATRRFDAILCDLMMPGMSGMELADILATRDPEHRRRMLFLTGGAVTPESDEFLSRLDVQYLTKPVTRTELHAALTSVRDQA